MKLYFTYESRNTVKSFTLLITLEHSDKFEIKFKKSRRGSRSPDNAEFDHFTMMSCRGRQRNVPRIIIKFPYNARSDWLKQRALSENRARVDDGKLASKILLRNFDKFDPN